MPLETSFINNIGVIGKASGSLSGFDIIQFNNELYSSLPLLSRFRYKLMDYSEVTSTNFSISDLKTLAEQDVVASNWNEKMLIAVVIREYRHQLLAKIWQDYTKNSNLLSKIFFNMDEAKAWINTSMK